MKTEPESPQCYAAKNKQTKIPHKQTNKKTKTAKKKTKTKTRGKGEKKWSKGDFLWTEAATFLLSGSQNKCVAKRGSGITIPGEQLSLSRWVRLEDLKRFLLTSVILWPSGKPCPERFLNQTDSFVLLLTGAASGDKKSNHTGGGRFWERTFLRGLSLCSLPLSEPSQFIIGVGKVSSKKDVKP